VYACAGVSTLSVHRFSSSSCLATRALNGVAGLAFRVAEFGVVHTQRAALVSIELAAAFLLPVQRPDTLLWLSRPLAAMSPSQRWREAALGWGTMLVLAIGPTLGGNGLYTVSLTRLPAATANLIATLEPAMTAVLAFVFLGERLTGPQLLGGSLILTGVLLLHLSDRAMQAARIAPPPSLSRSP